MKSEQNVSIPSRILSRLYYGSKHYFYNSSLAARGIGILLGRLCVTWVFFWKGYCMNG